MTALTDDGGPAFPRPMSEHLIPEGSVTANSQAGMSLLDYFAGQVRLAGVEDIDLAQAAGLDYLGPIAKDDKEHWVEDPGQPGDMPQRGPFRQWWYSLTLARRHEIYSKVVYAQAQAMLKERMRIYG